MLAVTIRSCIEELKPLGHENCEIIIVDNSDERIYKTLNTFIPIGYVKDRLVKVYRQDFPCLFTARETAVEKASGKYIVCVDSHMLIGHDMFLDLYNFMESNKKDKTLAFAHASISWAHQHERNAKHDRDMSVNELGNWNKTYKRARTITWKGMPWICKKDTWTAIQGYGALSQHKLSWGGGDLHIGIKPWLLGSKNWAVPCSPGIHIGPFPNEQKNGNKHISVVGRDKYRTYSASGNGPHTIGFLVSCYVLGGIPMMRRNKEAIQERFGKFIDVDKSWDQAKKYGEDEKAWLDERRVMTFEQLLATRPWNQS